MFVRRPVQTIFVAISNQHTCCPRSPDWGSQPLHKPKLFKEHAPSSYTYYWGEREWAPF